MTNLAEALRSIVGGSKNFCCLCFNICDAEDLVSIENEANNICLNNTENLMISDIIEVVLGNDVSNCLPEVLSQRLMYSLCKCSKHSLSPGKRYHYSNHANQIFCSCQ